MRLTLGPQMEGFTSFPLLETLNCSFTFSLRQWFVLVGVVFSCTSNTVAQTFSATVGSVKLLYLKVQRLPQHNFPVIIYSDLG